MRRLRLAAGALICAAAWALGSTAHAMSLAEAYRAARAHDAQFRAAGYELDAIRQVLPIARASLLPNVSLSAAHSNVTGHREFSNSLNQNVRVPLDYISPQASLQIRVPLLNYESFARYKQAGAQVLGAEAQFDVRGIELADRLVFSYIQMLLANDNVALAEAEIKALEEQVARALQRQQRGEGTRTEVAQSQATLDLTRARLVENQDQLDTAGRALRKLTGVEVTWLRNMAADYVPKPLVPQRLQEWLDLAEDQNPMLRSRRQNIEVARLTIERNKAGHLPRVDVIASAGRFRNESLSSLGQSSVQQSVGVQLSMPLYSGGSVEASVKQAVADLARIEEELRLERETLQVELYRQYNAATHGAQRIEAYRRAVASSEVALEGTTRGLAAGLGTNYDVLDAQAKRYTALRDLAQARYEYLVARARLMLQAGMPILDMITELDTALVLDTPMKSRTQP